ncbi:hypothetical protein H6G81_31360 [Scytonema hofmannii FACHB-248]|uniref:Uncharacterized protein n=1 Tax=Scytonema hofmannii FACHB-248 TaxID=1842502 RepID=A0ABR8H0U8_9CYAN|nr:MULTISPECIES: hypothetical protein [Nostocales]MBD2608896.1 hypothetical protein [Scytonema hofmannii FACHB-248]
MTNAIKIVGGGDYEPNLEKLGLKPYNSEMLVTEKVTATAVVPIVIASVSLIVGLANGIMGWLAAIGRDNEKREAFTRNFVEEAHKQFPDYNVVIIHTQHSTWGTWIHQHVELPMTIGTCGYEIYFSVRGQGFTLANNGDGGYLNWAYYGEYTRNSNSISAIEY